MKNLEEKKLLLKFAKMFGEPIDPALIESIEREERLLKALKVPEPERLEPTIEEVVEEADVVEINEQPFHDVKSVKTKTTQDDEATEQQTLLPPNKDEIIKSVVDLLDAPKQKTTPSSTPQVPDLYRKEIDGLRRSIADVIQKMGTLAWGGGGSGSVTINDMDDFDASSYKEGRYMRWANGRFRLAEVNPEDITNTTKLVTSNNYIVIDTDYYIGVNYAGPTTIVLPTTPSTGRKLVIKDESGIAATNPITVTGNVDNDPGGFIIAVNNGGVQLIYRDGWRII